MKNKGGVIVGSGVGFTALLQIVFIVLKLCGVITWKWVLVLLPLIIDGGMVALVIIVIVLSIVISLCIKVKEGEDL